VSHCNIQNEPLIYKIPHILIFYSSPYFTINMKNEKSDLTTLGVKPSEKGRESTAGTRREMPGAVLVTYFLKKNQQVPE
jgi:hypothetical protein